MSFDLLSRLSSLGLIRGLPKLKSEKDLVCHPCRHGKMTPISTSTALDEDLDGKAVDQKEYRSMIGSLLYLMATRPDI